MINVTKDKLAEMKVKEIKDLMDTADMKSYPDLWALFEEDNRASVKKMAMGLKRRYNTYARSVEKCWEMKALEANCYNQGYTAICGIDEVGRGPLAGPVVCAAVVMPKESFILGVDDSKKLSAKKRETLDMEIREEALAIAIAERSPEQIDALNILNATKEAMQEAINNLTVQPDLVLIDAVELDTQAETRSIIHGDATCYAIAAASIVAKVYRDQLMQAYHAQYPQYGFDRNMGYGTAEHIQAIQQYGLTPIHRQSFVKNIIHEKR